MNNSILIPVVIILLFGCSANEQGGQDTQGGQVAQGETPQFTDVPLNTAQGNGGGVVFRNGETSVRIRLLVGQKDSYHQIDIRYEGDLSKRVESLRLTSALTSLNHISGGDAVTGCQLYEDSSQVSFSIDWKTAQMHGDIAVTCLQNGSGTPIRVSGPFDVPVGPMGATEWNCNFGKTIKDCAFVD